MEVLSQLEPKEVFRYFEEISAIPRGSENTKQISDYCVDFAKEHKLSYIQDSYQNVIIIKEASSGYEDVPSVMLQGHIDMVCEKNDSVRHDFKTEGLKLRIMDDLVSAEGTTLGGDNGIAVAYCLAILADNTLKHPRIEAVLTSDEEIGMIGAAALDLSQMKSTMLLNLDSDDEGIFITSCAGGLRGECRVPIVYENKTGYQFSIIICGLSGGHSGTEIEKYHGNANMILGRLLHMLDRELGIEICEMRGGLQDNAIPRESKAEILVSEVDASRAEALIQEFEAVIVNEYKESESNIAIYGNGKGQVDLPALTKEVKDKILLMMALFPDGVQKMCMEPKGLVRTSLNLGIMKLKPTEFVLKSALRSSVSSEKYDLSEKLRYLTEYLGGSYKEFGDYPAWEYKSDSKLRPLMLKVFKEQYGKEPEFQGLHAGLEGGIIYEKMKGIDIISFGPNIYDIHTPKERLSISSTERTWKYLLEVLSRLNEI